MAIRKRHGFMFIEVLCVLVATGVAAALAAPRLQRTVDRSRVRTAASLLSNAVARAKVVATSRNCEAVVRIESGTHARVLVTACKRSGAGADTVSTSQVASAFNGRVTTTSAAIGFNSSGVRTVRETTVVKLIDADGVLAGSVIIDPVGRVKRT
jgi:Tfp pilus assembly protein FimT